MLRASSFSRFGFFVITLLICAGAAQATDIGGIISATLRITEDSQLVDDVTCTVSGAACIVFGAANIKLELNGFTVTGQADPQTGCSGAATAAEIGIDVNAQNNGVIAGPGLVQRFRGHGIRLLNSTGGKVTGATAATNCLSGIFVSGGSLNDVESSTAIRNGNLGSACGGI
jgi:hypothetical protein